MKGQEKGIEKIYVVRDTDSDGNKYISQILITYKEGNVKYFDLPPSKLERSDRKNETARKRMGGHLKNIVKKMDKKDLKKIVFVSDYDQKLRDYVDHEIQVKKSNIYRQLETSNQILSTSEAIASLVMMLSPLHGPANVFFNSLVTTIPIAFSINYNHKRKNLPQVEAEWFRKFRFSFSMVLLALNTTLGIKNLSLSLDSIKQNYVLQNESENVLQHRKLIIEELENPFESDTMFTSADAMTNVLMEAFDLNPLIEEEDREIASNLRQYLAENPYLDYEKLYDDFASFGIIDTNITHGNIVASSYDDYIIFYGRDNTTEEEYSNTLKHELVHRTGHLNCAMLKEGMTSLINYEYMSNLQYTDAYYDEILMTKIFCELITPDKMLEAYSKDDMSIIQNELLKLNPNEDTYQQFINLLNDYSVERKSYSNSGALSSFYDEGHALKYQDKFAMMVMDYMYNANFDEAKVHRITEYLKCIGTQTHLTIQGTIYFNQALKELSYANVYSSELEETANYHY